MKKLIGIVLLALMTMSFISIDNCTKRTALPIASIATVDCKIRQCNATAKSTGKRCKHCVSKSEDYQCWQHKPK